MTQYDGEVIPPSGLHPKHEMVRLGAFEVDCVLLCWGVGAGTTTVAAEVCYDRIMNISGDKRIAVVFPTRKMAALAIGRTLARRISHLKQTRRHNRLLVEKSLGQTVELCFYGASEFASAEGDGIEFDSVFVGEADWVTQDCLKRVLTAANKNASFVFVSSSPSSEDSYFMKLVSAAQKIPTKRPNIFIFDDEPLMLRFVLVDHSTSFEVIPTLRTIDPPCSPEVFRSEYLAYKDDV